MEITYVNDISVEDYNKLRASTGWNEMHPTQAEIGLKNSAYIVAAKDGETTVGTARVVSDGGHIAFIADVVVLPEYQRKGIGKAMMMMVMDHIDSGMKDGCSVHAQLMAAKGKEPFYEKFGFVTRPTEEFGAGMSQWIKR